jgi:hypothetical protein
MDISKVFKMKFAVVYPLYVAKAVRKGRTQEEVNTVICWLTGYSEKQLQEIIKSDCTFYRFFEDAPHINPNVTMIKGSICGFKVQEIKDPLLQKIRYLDKLIDELAKGRKMKKILRGNE